MKHLDITIDFETCSLSANAAPMMLAAVVWDRNAETDPLNTGEEPFVGHVDLRSCFVDNLDFDAETARWWASRSNAAKSAVTDGIPEEIGLMMERFHRWILDLKERHPDTTFCLWSQGTDVDLAILRNLYRLYVVNLEEDIRHTFFRDCRTVILEAALIKSECNTMRSIPENGIMPPEQILAGGRDVYKMFEPMPGQYSADQVAHDALFDARQSSWNTWQALRWLRA